MKYNLQNSNFSLVTQDMSTCFFFFMYAPIKAFTPVFFNYPFLILNHNFLLISIVSIPILIKAIVFRYLSYIFFILKSILIRSAIHLARGRRH